MRLTNVEFGEEKLKNDVIRNVDDVIGAILVAIENKSYGSQEK
jgi:hypothetical protein